MSFGNTFWIFLRQVFTWFMIVSGIDPVSGWCVQPALEVVKAALNDLALEISCDFGDEK